MERLEIGVAGIFRACKLRDSFWFLSADDSPFIQDLAMWLEKCYQIVLSGQRHFMLTSLEWAVLDWVVPRCLPPSADLTSSSLTLEETLRPRLFYTNATHLVSRVEIPKSSLDEASIRLLGGSDSGLLDSIPPCAVEALRGNVNRALVSSSPVAEAVLATVARHCAGVELAILKWESVAKELENVPGFGIRVRTSASTVVEGDGGTRRGEGSEGAEGRVLGSVSCSHLLCSFPPL